MELLQLVSQVYPAQTSTAPIWQAVVGFNPDGTLKFSSVNWMNREENIYYTGANIGIGTPTPSAKVDIRGVATNQTSLRVSASNAINVATDWPSGWSGIQTWDILAQSVKLNDSIFVANNANIVGDVVMNGQNGWRLHTPDDGRTSMWFWKQANNWSVTSWPFEYRQDGTFMASHIWLGAEKLDLLGWGASLNVNGSIRAARYYDDDTNYYIDSNVTSQMNEIRANAFLYRSDRRLKKDITLLSGSLDKILQLHGYSYLLRSDNRKDIGIIAQEVEGVFPELVHTDPETGMKSVEYANLIAPLIEAVKEQQEEIDTLRSEIAEIRNQLRSSQQ